MSYITPDSYIYILEGVPFDETYQHSIYFADTSAQYNYFSSKIKYRFNAQSYQRVRRGYCRVQQKADRMYDCNYMMFQNTSYGTKWFYAFINDVTYINDSVSEIHYEIDVIQSWLFRPASGSTEFDTEFAFNKCFVNREHTATDALWEHNVPEGLDIGDYKISDIGANIMTNTTPAIVVVSTAGYFSDQDHTIIDYDGGYMWGGIYTGARYNVFSGTSAVSDANALLKAITEAGKSDSIVGVYMMPLTILDNSGYSTPYSETVTFAPPTTSIDGYIPRNKKLFSSPYQILAVDVWDTCATYNYEYFNYQNASNISLTVNATPADMGKYCVYPNNYKGQLVNKHEMVYGNCGCMCTYSIDSYKAWLAQNQYVLSAQERVIENNSIVSNMYAGMQTGLGIGSSLSGGTIGKSVPFVASGGGGSVNELGQLGLPGGGVTPIAQSSPGGFDGNINGNVVSGVMGRIAAVKQRDNAYAMLEATKKTASIKPNIPMGSSVNVTRIATSSYIPRVYNMYIRREFAEIIDGYFDRYGYAVHTFKVPSLRNRPYWTYVQTVDCTIRGNIPNDDSTAICSIFNGGITFWASGANVGNYSLDNSPT